MCALANGDSTLDSSEHSNACVGSVVHARGRCLVGGRGMSGVSALHVGWLLLLERQVESKGPTVVGPVLLTDCRTHKGEGRGGLALPIPRHPAQRVNFNT